MRESNKVLFIINRFSGTSYRPALENKILTHCQKNNIEGLIEFTREAGHATVLAKHAAENKYRMVFAVGGDGTVNEVAKGLLHSAVPLGIIPRGSGNGLARHLQIPFDIDSALCMTKLDKTLSIDTFTINNRLSINVSGIGFDGHIATLFGKNGKRGLFSYIKLVVSHFGKFEEFEYEQVLDGIHSNHRAFIITCANSSQFGNNATIAPHASICDQLLDICHVNKMSLFQGLIFIQKLFRGTIDKSSHIKIRKAKEIELTTSGEIPFHVDGEAAGVASHFIIKVNPTSLLVAVPLNVRIV